VKNTEKLYLTNQLAIHLSVIYGYRASRLACAHTPKIKTLSIQDHNGKREAFKE